MVESLVSTQKVEGSSPFGRSNVYKELFMSDTKQVRLKESISINSRVYGEYSLSKDEVMDIVIDNDDFENILVSHEDRPLTPISLSREMIEYL